MRAVAGSILIVGSLLWIALLAVAAAIWKPDNLSTSDTIWAWFVRSYTNMPFVVAFFVAALGISLILTGKEPRE